MPLGKKIAFLGAGNMAEALVKGLLRAKSAEPEEILCTARRKPRAAELAERYGVRTSSDNKSAAADSEILVLSVKPQAMNKLLEEIASVVAPSGARAADKLVISIAAGVPIEAIERKL